MAIVVPKFVAIHNLRLELLYVFLVLAALTWIIYDFVINQSWKAKIPISNHIGLEAWLEFNTTSLAKAEDLPSLPHCLSPQQYDYWWNADYQYTNHRCLPMCSIAGNIGSCFHPRDYYLNNPLSQNYMAVTSIKEIRKGITSHYFLPFADAVVFRFAIALSVPQYDWLTGTLSTDQANDIKADTRSDLPVVLLNTKGQAFQTLLPTGFAFTLTLEDIFTMCDYSGDFLDRPWVENKSPNLMPNSSTKYQDGPAPRIAGTRILMDMKCYDTEQNGHDTLPSEFRDKAVCYISARMDHTKWPFIEKDYILNEEGDQLRKIIKGISVEVKVDGTWHWFSFQALVLATVAASVLLNLPTKIMTKFSTTCLGQLSQVYREVIVQPFSLPSQCGSIAAKLMANSISFVELADANGSDGRNGISSDRMAERLGTTLKHRGATLDKAEVLRLSNFCFDEVANAKNNALFGLHVDGCRAFCGRGSKSARVERDVIDIDEFGVAVSRNDGVSLDSIVKLFDSDRRIFPGERFFFPSDMWKVVHLRKTKELKSQTNDPGTTRSVSIEDMRATRETQFNQFGDALTQVEEMHAEFLGLQTRQAKVDSEVKALQLQVKQLQAEHIQGSVTTEPAANQASSATVHSTANATADAIAEMRQEMHSFKDALTRSRPQGEDLQVQSVRSQLRIVDERVAAIESRLEHFPTVFDETTKRASPPSLTEQTHSPNAYNMAEQIVTEHIKALETSWSQQVALLQNKYNARFALLEKSIQAGATAPPLPIPPPPRHCADDWSVITCLSRDRARSSPPQSITAQREVAV